MDGMDDSEVRFPLHLLNSSIKRNDDMVNYILRRFIQALPQLFLISIILFVLMQAFGDPIASLGVRTPPRPADRERLRRQLGLDQPVYVQYLVWLACNDWMNIDMDGDGV